MTAYLRTCLLVYLVIGVTVTSADAAPSISSHSLNSFGPAISPHIPIQKYGVLTDAILPPDIFILNIDTWQTTSAYEANFELTSRLDNISESNKRIKSQVKSLPAAPDAVMMGIVGFLFVTMVRDRRFWLSVFAGMIMIGQAGIITVPKITASFLKAKPQVSRPALANSYTKHIELFNGKVVTEKINYIGLLHRLAGSPYQNESALSIGSKIFKACRLTDILSQRSCDFLLNKTEALKPVIADSCPNLAALPSPICYLRHKKPSYRFSAAFIFVNLPRGPPESTHAQIFYSVTKLG